MSIADNDRDATPAAVALAIRGVSKAYRRMGAGFRLRTLKSALVNGTLTGDLGESEIIRALADIDFEVGRGECFGVIGGNGSGKSTLLKLLAGLIRPSSGRIEIDGRVAALIELGAGFHPEISGRENVFINGSILGLSRRQIEERFDDIVAFSELEEFIEEPVKNYSSGMYVRLGFAVAIHTDPDILLVDEVLAVGDEAFAHSCLRRIQRLLADGRTIVLVSHSLALVEELCDRVLWLDHGQMAAVGEPREVIDAYRQRVAEGEGRHHQKRLEERIRPEQREDDSASELVDRWGSRQAEIIDARLLVGGEERYHLRSGAQTTFEMTVRANQPLDDFVFGVAISTPRGVECWGTNTDIAGFSAGHFAGTATVRLHCPSLRLGGGEYEVDVAVHSREGAPYDYRKRLLRFAVQEDQEGAGVYSPEHDWGFEGALQWRTNAEKSSWTGENSDE